MKYLLLLLLFARPADARAPLYHSADHRPNPHFLPRTADGNFSPGNVEQVSEVVILEGDEDLVSVDEQGNYGIFGSGGQQAAITNRFFTQYADEFDAVIVFTTFTDKGTEALAYEMSVQQDVFGIGMGVHDGSISWGAGEGKLHSFVDMMRWDQYRYNDGLEITDPRSMLYPVLGQEFAHRWLSFFKYRDQQGKVSKAILGRDESHWASTLQADASVMDGNRIVDNSDGTFTNAESSSRFSPLDLYGMGLLPASEVPPFFLVRDAIDMKGNKINPAHWMHAGTHFTGQREDITIEQVISAVGKRSPSAANSPHDFRVAFVLLTRPKEKVAEVVSIARKIDVVRRIWEQKFAEYSAGRGTMCTQISAPCGAATAKLTDTEFQEAGGNGNGFIEPGEPVRVTLHFVNDGPVDPSEVLIQAFSSELNLPTDPVPLIGLQAGSSRAITFLGQMATDAKCGDRLALRTLATVDSHTSRGFVTWTPGISDRFRASYDGNQGLFGANLNGQDSAANGWQWGVPQEYRGKSGWIFQPKSCHNDSSKCWFTGLQAGHRAMSDSSVVGQTRLYSPALDIRHTHEPMLRYFTWYQALDFSNPKQGGMVIDHLAMLTEASSDGGTNWVKLDSVDGAEAEWRERTVQLEGKVPLDRPLIVRFTVSNNVATNMIEAGIDDFQIVTQTQACGEAPLPKAPLDPMVGGGCALGRHDSPLILLTLFGLLVLRRRR